jgi:hypothetical protein
MGVIKRCQRRSLEEEAIRVTPARDRIDPSTGKMALREEPDETRDDFTLASRSFRQCLGRDHEERRKPAKEPRANAQ